MGDICKCVRCGDFKELFQYTLFEPDRWIRQIEVCLPDENGNTRREKLVNIAQSRGLCKECAIEVNKREYDIRKK